MRKLLHLVGLLLTVATGARAALYVTSAQAAFPAEVIKGAAAVPVTGVLIYGALGDAPDPAWSGKVVLLDRGVLLYPDKVNAVKAAGGIAVVIANNVAVPLVGPTLGTNHTSPLTALAVTMADGIALRNLAGSVVTVGATSPPAPASVDPLPPQDGRAGGALITDGAKASWGKLIAIGPATSGTVKTGAALAFLVAADGLPAPSFQWFKDGATLAGATTPTLVIASASPADAGIYTCTATNESGSSTSGPYNLTVTP